MDNNNYNNYSDYNNYNGYNNYNQVHRAEIRCPGKEIATLVLGINALEFGVFGLVFCWHIIFAFVYGLIGIGCGIAAIVLNGKIIQQATVITRKASIGKGLSVAGIVCSGIAIFLSIIITVVFGFMLIKNGGFN